MRHLRTSDMARSQEELEKYRHVRIHQLLGLQDIGRKVAVRCPFHSEKSPSFYVFPDGGFKCFGCAKNGHNAIDFLTSFEGVTFNEALEELDKYI
jgi:DNA primase